MFRGSTIAGLALLAMLWGNTGQAGQLNFSGTTPGTVLLNQSTPETASFDTLIPLVPPSAGQLFVSLTDEGTIPGSGVPAFASIQFGINNVGGPLVPLAGPGVETLDITTPQPLYLEVLGSPVAGSYGIFNLEATFVPASAVPLPPALSLLLVGLALMALRSLASRVPLSEVTLVGCLLPECNTAAIPDV